MKLYDLLASEYTQLFPSSEEKRQYAEKLISTTHGEDMLDLGCASGEFPLQLTSPGRTITGIDPDSRMISEARAIAAEKESITFAVDDMLSFLSSAPPHSFDVIFCMGNTIAYLTDERELERFLSSARNALREGGKLLIQMLNYTNPSIKAGFHFPDLNSTHITFSRRYEESGTPGVLAFTTQVRNKENGETHNEVHSHAVFTSDTVRELGREAGFREVTVHGSYENSPPEQENFFRLVTLTV